MANLFFRTNVAPYRVDTYNALNEKLDCRMYFMSRTDSSQNYDIGKIERRCKFKPEILEKGGFLGIPYHKNIWKIIRENNPDIVIVPEFKLITLQALAYKFLFRKKMKVISMCDDSYDMVAHGKDFTRTHKLARKLVTPFLDDLLLVDDKVCRWFRDKYGKGQWLPIMRDEKVEIPLYRKAEEISEAFKTRYDLADKKILLYVGRLAEVKNISTLIRAVKQTHTDFTTVIIGDGPLKEQLKKEASETNRDIRFLGRFEDAEIRAWYNIADIFVLPSSQEPFGAVTNEALLGGCFTLLSEACGSTCLIDESNGKIFDPASSEQLAALIDESFIKLAESDSKSESRMNLTFDESVVKVIENLKKS
ncbi:MAG: glycosyltransferase family 4 protein [Muribaculaceae bacterium]|nr:glycosyltransferase family 4 protein [Muribaculaceae bacterium]